MPHDEYDRINPNPSAISIALWQKFLFTLPVLLRAHALHPREELGEGSLVGEVEVVGQLGDGAVSGFQSQRGLGSKRLVEEINHGATAHLTDNAREVGGGDAEQLGIELKVAVADKVIGNKTQECGKDLFCTGCEAVAVDGKILCLQQFDAEQGTEREDGLLLIGRRMEDVATGHLSKKNVRQFSLG